MVGTIYCSQRIQHKTSSLAASDVDLRHPEKHFEPVKLQVTIYALATAFMALHHCTLHLWTLGFWDCIHEQFQDCGRGREGGVWEEPEGRGRGRAPAAGSKTQKSPSQIQMRRRSSAVQGLRTWRHPAFHAGLGGTR